MKPHPDCKSDGLDWWCAPECPHRPAPEPKTFFLGQEPELAPGVRGYTVDSGDKGFYVPLIYAEDEGSGAVGAYLDGLPRDRRVVFPTVLSGRLAGMLQRRGFVMAWEDDPEFGPVEVWERLP